MSRTSFSVWSLCIILALMSVTHSFVCTEEMYEEYLTHWGRNFAQEKQTSEYSARLDAYCQNRQKINQINAQNLDYELDIYWQWMDKSETERKQLVRVEFTPEAIAATAVPIEQVEGLRKVGAALPANVDYRIPGYVSSIKSQGSCGCCWSFTTVGTYESWMMLKGEKEYDLSEQYLLECTTKFTKNVKKQNYESTCVGGYVDFSGELARINGIPTQQKFPYIAFNYTGTLYPTTPGICEANQTIMFARDPNVTTFVSSKNNSQTKMKELIAYGPVAALIYGDFGFQAYKSGIYSGCPSSFSQSFRNINHAVVIVGYDVDGNYIVKNSWGTQWGTNGFGVVSKDRDCGLSAYTFQYVSSASAGSGVMFYNQTNLNSPSGNAGYHLLTSLILLVVALALIN